MKFSWELEDIKGGRRFSTPGGEPSIIAYDTLRNDDKYAVVSLRDGSIVVQGQTRAAMARYLTDNNAAPAEL